MLKKVHPVMRPAIYIFIFVSVASLVAVSWSYSYMNDADQAQMSERRAMRLWKNKIDDSTRSNQVISEYENSYMQLIRNNVVGEENRLSWFEALQSIANSRGLSSLKYSISSQKKIEDPKNSNKGKGLVVYRSEMSLGLDMLHEGDLFVLLNDLEEKAKGLFVVERCDIDMSESNDINVVGKMHASCDLGWYTFKSSDDPAVSKGKGKSKRKGKG